MDDMDGNNPRISVCVCTYKRPKMLGNLLASLQDQKTNQRFSYSIIVVDNDSEESGRAVTESFQMQAKIRIEYHVEPKQNIALARNKAVQMADGNYFALIDDDEYPIDDWLLFLYEAITAYKVEGVLGPVIPHFAVDPPKWIVKGKFCDRERFGTGTYIRKPADTRTSNVLLSRVLFDNNETPFDSRFGLTGGEDTDFFKRMMKQGNKFIWCDEACVFETVPAERLSRAYFLKRALLRGVANAEGVSPLSINVGKSAFATVYYIVSLPLRLVLGHDIFMRGLIKMCDHLSKVLATMGLRVITRRTF